MGETEQAMTSTMTERPVGTPFGGPSSPTGGVDLLTRPTDLTEDQIALTHQFGTGPAVPTTGAARPTEAGPVLHPPGTPGAAAAQNLIGTWQTKQVLALFNTRAGRTGWAYLDGVGWRRLAIAGDSAHMALDILASASRSTGRQVVARDEADGQIHEIYLW
jgi:hypothetical protein